MTIICVLLLLVAHLDDENLGRSPVIPPRCRWWASEVSSWKWGPRKCPRKLGGNHGIKQGEICWIFHGKHGKHVSSFCWVTNNMVIIMVFFLLKWFKCFFLSMCYGMIHLAHIFHRGKWHPPRWVVNKFPWLREEGYRNNIVTNNYISWICCKCVAFPKAAL